VRILTPVLHCLLLLPQHQSIEAAAAVEAAEAAAAAAAAADARRAAAVVHINSQHCWRVTLRCAAPVRVLIFASSNGLTTVELYIAAGTRTVLLPPEDVIIASTAPTDVHLLHYCIWQQRAQQLLPSGSQLHLNTQRLQLMYSSAHPNSLHRAQVLQLASLVYRPAQLAQALLLPSNELLLMRLLSPELQSLYLYVLTNSGSSNAAVPAAAAALTAAVTRHRLTW
jgi:hypothetical protein